jgi:hypothetical protein
MSSRVDFFFGSRNLHTPHPADSYPGVRIFDAGDGWNAKIICAQSGQTFTALGGEHCFAYETPDGIRAGGFTLGPGDRATVLDWKEETAFLAEWQVERAG